MDNTMPQSHLFVTESALTTSEDPFDDATSWLPPPPSPPESAPPVCPADWFRDERYAVAEGLDADVWRAPPSSLSSHGNDALDEHMDPVDAIFYGSDSIKYLNQRIVDAEAREVSTRREEALLYVGDDWSHDVLFEDPTPLYFDELGNHCDKSLHFVTSRDDCIPHGEDELAPQSAPSSPGEPKSVNAAVSTKSPSSDPVATEVPGLRAAASDYDLIGYRHDDGGASSDSEYDCTLRASRVSEFFAASRTGPRFAVPQLLPADASAPVRTSRRIWQRRADEIAKLPQQTPLSRLYDSVPRLSDGGATAPIDEPSAWTHGGPLPVRPKHRRRVRAALRRQWGSAHLAYGFEYCFESRFADAATRDAMARHLRRAGYADVDRPVTSGCAKLDHLLRRRAFPDLGVGFHKQMGLSVVNRGPGTIRSGDWIGEYVGTIMSVGDFVQLCRRARRTLGLATPFTYGYALRTPSDRHTGRRANHANARRSRRPDVDPYSSYVVTPLAGPMNVFLFLNGSCHSNVEYVELSIGGAMRVFLRATRDIPTGGHIRASYDDALPVLRPELEGVIYEDEDPDSLECRCGNKCFNASGGEAEGGRRSVDIYGRVASKRRRRLRGGRD